MQTNDTERGITTSGNGCERLPQRMFLSERGCGVKNVEKSKSLRRSLARWKKDARSGGKLGRKYSTSFNRNTLFGKKGRGKHSTGEKGLEKKHRLHKAFLTGALGVKKEKGVIGIKKWNWDRLQEEGGCETSLFSAP